MDFVFSVLTRITGMIFTFSSIYFLVSIVTMILFVYDLFHHQPLIFISLIGLRLSFFFFFFQESFVGGTISKSLQI